MIDKSERYARDKNQTEYFFHSALKASHRPFLKLFLHLFHQIKSSELAPNLFVTSQSRKNRNKSNTHRNISSYFLTFGSKEAASRELLRTADKEGKKERNIRVIPGEIPE